MFNYYKIINYNKEEVLCLYINNDFEFSNEFNNTEHKSNNIFSNIKKFIAEKKIDFNGKKIFIIINGIIISTILLSTSFKLNYDTDSYTYVNKLKPLFVIQDELPKQKIEDNAEDNTNLAINQETIDKPKVQLTEEIILENQNKTSTNIINQLSPTIPPSVTAPEKNIEAPPEVQQTIPAEKVVTIYRNNGPIIMSLEEYVIGVVGAEMPASFNIEALKSQSVIARTYALKRIAEGKQLSDTKMNHLYYDNNQLQQIWGSSFNAYYNKIKSAVETTKGQYLAYNNYYIDALYHSTSNGKTEDSINVWGGSFPYLRSVDSPWDLNASSYLRTITLSLSDISNALGFEVNNETNIQIVSKTSSDRVDNIQIGTNTYKGIEIRDLLDLRSADFDISIANDTVTITTRGYGHGVGLSQYGSNGMANSGTNYKKILEHYYPNTVLKS